MSAFRYVREHEAPAYVAAGWVQFPDPIVNAPQGVWSCLMQWPGEGDPVEPHLGKVGRQQAISSWRGAPIEMDEEFRHIATAVACLES